MLRLESHLDYSGRKSELRLRTAWAGTRPRWEAQFEGMAAIMDTKHMTLLGRAAERDAWVTDRCSIDRTFGIVGTRSAVLLLREASYGTTRFDDFVKRVDITGKVAAARLGELVEAGLLERRPHRQQGKRTRHEYVLTPAGAELLPVLLALMQWGDRHLAGTQGPPLVLRHMGCGAPIAVEVRCEAEHVVPLDEIGVQFAGEDWALPSQADGDGIIDDARSEHV